MRRLDGLFIYFENLKKIEHKSPVLTQSTGPVGEIDPVIWC
jgi:hypothetical protein